MAYNDEKCQDICSIDSLFANDEIDIKNDAITKQENAQKVNDDEYIMFKYEDDVLMDGSYGSSNLYANLDEVPSESIFSGLR